ncbi:MAG: xylulokinase, partial [Deltaproteobacteria bacterium]|nr:xylulokinase [Deltaproteobacteria bacterium]
MFLGIDLGTSSVKAVIADDEDRVVAHATVPLAVERPQPLWSEQDPEAWWRATCEALDGLAQRNGRELAGVRGIGLSGQMHGATLLDAADRVLRPAILWNLAMPGFTAPKLVWVAQHEPELFARVAKVLLPKDYLRLRLSGDHASEMSDASGTLWLDVAERRWSPAMLEATRLEQSAMPRLHEGSEPTGELRGELARRWGMQPGVVIAGGGGDQAAG